MTLQRAVEQPTIRGTAAHFTGVARQILVATSGIGRFQVKGGPVRDLLPGDGVSIAPGEVHWHGAAPDQLFVHTSVQAADKCGQQATWLEPVTDQEYAERPG